MTLNPERIDIGGPLRQLCARLELTYEDVAEIVFRPGDVLVTTFVRNEHGSVQINNRGTGPLSSQRTFKVRT